MPTSRYTEILSRFPTINNRILTHIGSKARFKLRTNFIVLDVCEIAELHQPSSSPVPCLIPCLGVTLRCLEFHLSNSFGRHIGVTPPSERPASHTAGHVDHEKRNAWVSIFLCVLLFYVSPISIVMGLRYPALRPAKLRYKVVIPSLTLLTLQGDLRSPAKKSTYFIHNSTFLKRSYFSLCKTLTREPEAKQHS